VARVTSVRGPAARVLVVSARSYPIPTGQSLRAADTAQEGTLVSFRFRDTGNEPLDQTSNSLTSGFLERAKYSEGAAVRELGIVSTLDAPVSSPSVDDGLTSNPSFLAGIVILVVLILICVLVIAILLWYFCFRRPSRRKDSSSPKSSELVPEPNSPPTPRDTTPPATRVRSLPDSSVFAPRSVIEPPPPPALVAFPFPPRGLLTPNSPLRSTVHPRDDSWRPLDPGDIDVFPMQRPATPSEPSAVLVRGVPVHGRGVFSPSMNHSVLSRTHTFSDPVTRGAPRLVPTAVSVATRSVRSTAPYSDPADPRTALSGTVRHTSSSLGNGAGVHPPTTRSGGVLQEPVL